MEKEKLPLALPEGEVENVMEAENAPPASLDAVVVGALVGACEAKERAGDGDPVVADAEATGTLTTSGDGFVAADAQAPLTQATMTTSAVLRGD